MFSPDLSTAKKALCSPESYQVLYELGHGTAPDQAIVELGTYYGASAIALAQGARDGCGSHVWTIDPHDLPGQRTTTSSAARARNTIDYTDPSIRESAAASIREAGLSDRITMVRDFGQDAACTWEGPRVGLLFIDGNHRLPAVRLDFSAWEKHLASRAVVVWDDYKPNYPGVVETVHRLLDKGVLEDLVAVESMAVTWRSR